MTDDLDRDLEHLFDAARRATEATPGDRRRIHAALSAKVATGLVLIPAAAKSASAAGGLLGKGLKLVLYTQILPGLVVGTLLGGGASWLASETTRAEVAPLVSAAIPPSKAVQPGAVAASSRAEANPGSGAVPPRAGVQPPSAGPGTRPATPLDSSACANESCGKRAVAAFPGPTETSDLGSELALVSRMHQAWQDGNWPAVKDAIRAHERAYPRGTLTEERRAVAVMLACRTAEPAQARALAQDFARAHPGSTHRGRVSAACGIEH
jgi:hypothetical protein